MRHRTRCFTASKRIAPRAMGSGTEAETSSARNSSISSRTCTNARSLRVNFELNVEGYGREFARQMEKVIEKKISAAREVTLAEVDKRSLPAKLRDAIARLFSPYL